MKNRISLSVLFLILAFSVELNAQDSNALKISLFLEADTLRFLDPWDFKVEIKNTSDIDVDFMPTMIIGGCASMSSEIKLEIRNHHLNSWTDSKVIINQCSPQTGFKLYKLKPNELIRYEFHCAPPVELLEIGPNEVRISHANFCSSGNTYYSAPGQIQIVKYEDQDLAVYNYLRGLPNPAFILFPIISTGNDTSEIANAEYIVKNFPDSYLSEYGKLYLSYQYLRKSYSELILASGTEQVLYYLRKSKKIGISLLTTHNSRILDKTHSLLKQYLFDVAVRAYNYDLPEEIEKEFTFPLKH